MHSRYSTRRAPARSFRPLLPCSDKGRSCFSESAERIRQTYYAIFLSFQVVTVEYARLREASNADNDLIEQHDSGSFFHSLSHPSVHWRWGHWREHVRRHNDRNAARTPGKICFHKFSIGSAVPSLELRLEDVAEAIVFVLARPRNVVIRDPIVLPACAGLIAGTSRQANHRLAGSLLSAHVAFKHEPACLHRRAPAKRICLAAGGQS